jgi:hypothetical protein
MANGCEFLTSPSLDVLQSEVFKRVSDQAGDQPGSILYIENNDHRIEEIEDTWASDCKPLRLRVTDFNTIVGGCYERIVGPSSILSTSQSRLVRTSAC